jgi:hypothetical protein
MAGIRLLHGVDRQGTNGVDTKLIQIFRAHGVSLAGQGFPSGSAGRPFGCKRWMHHMQQRLRNCTAKRNPSPAGKFFMPACNPKLKLAVNSFPVDKMKSSAEPHALEVSMH